MNLRKRLASQSAIIFGARLFGAGLTFLVQAAIARALGSAILGEYLLIIATVNLVAVVMPLGFETIGTYFAAEYRAKGEGRLLWGFLARAYGHVAVMALALFVFAYPIAALFGEPGKVFTSHWMPACLLAFSTALVFVNGAILVGLKRPFAGFFADTLFRPLVIIAAFLVGLTASSPEGSFSILMWGVSLGYTAIGLVHFGFVIATARRIPTEIEPRHREWKRWWRFAMPWVVIALASDFFFDIDLLVLSNLLSREELAIFGVCTRVFSLVSFGVAAVYAVTLPDMFESEAKSDRAGFHRKIGDANLVASSLSVLLFLLVSIGGPLALMIFGPAFMAGAAPLAVLCLALVVRSALGPASLVLSVHDRPYATLPAIGLGIVALVGGNMLLVPHFGIMGAALAALISMTLWSGAMWLTTLKTAGVDVSIYARITRWREDRAVSTIA
ncbi:MAG: Polysaccharide biosynthesis associated protein [Hyphomicrobiales bacterium]|nr:Polysaccharide biosynthesis associated protein [Hyphomicrobiales bacterium]